MKISIIGAGNVGASTAYALALRGVASDISLIDIASDIAKAKAMDISQAGLVFGLNLNVKGGDSYDLAENSDVVVITAGSPRKQGQSRQDLLLKNASIVSQCAKAVAKNAPNSIIIVVTNPLDEMVWAAWQASGFKSTKVLGMAGELDSARYRYSLIKNGLSLEPKALAQCVVLGAHSDEMIPVRSGLGLEQESYENVIKDTKNGGATIVGLLGTSAYYAPAAGVCRMCEAIAKGGDKVVASALLDDELACGRELWLDSSGVARVEPLRLSEAEVLALKQSESKIKENINFLKQNL